MYSIPGNGQGGMGEMGAGNEMSKDIIDVCGGIVFIIMGLLFAVFSGKLADRTSGFYFRMFHLSFSQAGYRIVFIVIGTCFLLFGSFQVFNVIR